MRQSSNIVLISLIVATGLLSGCVRKRMTIVSNPPGAQVFIDNREIGSTPVSTAYQYYGTREIRLQKDGFETITVKRNFDPPWYEYPPFDLFSESFVTHEFRDERILDFQLIPMQKVPADTVRDRAEELRMQARTGQIVPLRAPQLENPAP